MSNKIVEKFIEIKADTQQAFKDIKDLFNTMLDKQIEVEKQQKDINDEVKNTGKSAENSKKGVDSLSNGFKGMGLAIKAIGIGLLLDALNILKDVFGSNQKVLDIFNTAIGALKMAFTDFFNYIDKNIGGVVNSFKAIFNDPKQAIEDFGNLIKENLIERFNSFLDTIGYVSSAIAKVFKGDFKGAMDDVAKAGKESIDVFTGVNNTVDRTVQTIKDVAESVSEYTKKVWNASEANVELQKQAEIALARNQGLIEKYDRLAEKQRQIRDDEFLSINERIEANVKLGNLLKEQSKFMTENANIAVESAKRQYNLNKNQENYIALITAQNNVSAVSAQIEGFRSEQLLNQNTLLNARIKLERTASDALKQRIVDDLQFNEEINKSEENRYKNRKRIIEEQAKQDLEAYELSQLLYIEGTQALADADALYLAQQQETNQSAILNELEHQKKIQEVKIESYNRIIDNDKELFETRYQILDVENALILASTTLTEEEKTRILNENAKKRISIEQAEADQKNAISNAQLDLVVQGANVAKQLDEKNKALQKSAVIAENAAGIAKIITNTQAANAKAVAASPLTGGQPWVGINTIGAGLGIASSVLATNKALKELGGGSVSGSVGSGGGGGTAPKAQFDIVGTSSTNQLASRIGQSQNQPINAYVVGADVTTQQELDRNKIINATVL